MRVKPVPFTPWSVDGVAPRFVAWRFNNGRREEHHEKRATFMEAMADCDELNARARQSPEWIEWCAQRDTP